TPPSAGAGAAKPAGAAAKGGGSVRVTFEFGGQAAVQQREVVWREGMTVLDALLTFPAGEMDVQHRGGGARA
ncbi:MAG: hypothetical protein GTO03_14550, partial [Planctomycetales bacterium]|nr:hypothetical protein [Planctomycetales bacterium]